MSVSGQTAEPLEQKQVNNDDGLVELMELLEEIDENKPSAKFNEDSMIDNNGHRIYY